MQQGRPEISSGQSSIDMPQDAVTIPAEGNTCETFSFNVDAPEFYPARQDLQNYPEDVQDLYMLWSQRTFAWDNAERRGDIITWYIDQQDPARRVCRQPRRVSLTEALHTWELSIRQTWHDMMVDAPVTWFDLLHQICKMMVWLT